MKRLLITLALLLPAVASAQIYPLTVYANAKRDNGQEIKFLRSESGLTYVGLCKGSKDDKLCDLAKDGSYALAGGIKFRTKNMGQLYSADGSQHCTYSEGTTLDCD